MNEARELLLKHLYLQGGDGLGISNGLVYNACLDAIMEALTIPVVSNCTTCNDEINYKGVCEMCYTELKLNDLD